MGVNQSTGKWRMKATQQSLKLFLGRSIKLVVSLIKKKKKKVKRPVSGVGEETAPQTHRREANKGIYKSAPKDSGTHATDMLRARQGLR